MAEELQGKVAVVTGGASGLGRAMVERFAAEGAAVVVADIDDATGAALAGALGERAAFQHTDVTSADDVQALVDTTVERFGGLHVMVNNAGVGSAMARFLHDELTDFRQVMDIDVLGVLLGCQRAARHMKAAGTRGSIINVSSTAGLDAGAALVTYRAAKAAVIHASRSIALDVAGYGIRVNCLVPGGIRTPMTASSYDVDAVRALTQPLDREGLPEDVAEAALFLASDRSAQITGVTLPVDGGTTTGPPAKQLQLLMARQRQQ
jgi:NAD(P)-dependent dehydrogenase (short-subunit alcohol dehydrogenase family)